MLGNIHPKYTLKVEPKIGTGYNYVHDLVTGRIATVVDLEVGKRGWIATWDSEDESWHRLHTSAIECMEIDEAGNITVTTRNTRYTLIKIT